MKNEKIMEALEKACAAACRRFPGDWKKAGRPAPADLVGAAWIELQTAPESIGTFEAAKRALFAEAWSFSGHSAGGSIEELTGLEAWDGDNAAADMAEAAEAMTERGDVSRPAEDAIITRATLEAVAGDALDRRIMAAVAAGLNQQETADALKISRATVNRRIQAMRERLQK